MRIKIIKQIMQIKVLVMVSFHAAAGGPDMHVAAENFISRLRGADSIGNLLSEEKMLENRPDFSVDSLFRNILKDNAQIYALLKINRQGRIENDVNRDSISDTTRNVKGKAWFDTPLFSGKVHNGGVVSANSRICFLKTYPLTTNDPHLINNGVVAVLIDLKNCLGEPAGNNLSPFALLYDNSVVFQSDPPVPVSRVTVPDFEKLELICHNSGSDSPELYGPDNRKAGSDIFASGHKSTLPTFLPWSITILTILMTLFTFLSARPGIKKEELIAQAYRSLPEKTHKLIHDRAIAQLYCEIKRQVETHESDRIREEVREKIAAEFKLEEVVS